jgi:hypothetical protein
MRIRFITAALIGAAVTLPVAWARWIGPAKRGWGAGPNDLRRPLPGDEVVPEPDIVHTRAVTIDAPPSAVWPWLIQIGQGRGGLYSYDLLEGLIGCDIHSVDGIVPELQDLRVGDIVSLRKGDMPAFLVRSIEPEHALVLVARDPQTGGPATPGSGPFSLEESWSFAVEAVDGGQRTRLLSRSRRRTQAAFGDRVFWQAVDLVSLPMERKMLLGIKARAERPVATSARTASPAA